jgi:uncharacterized membrane protein YfcA
MLLFLALGIFAGMLTTVAGMGGGLFLVAVVGILRGPHEALAITSPALLVSNLQRTVMFRQVVDRRVAALLSSGAIPGAVLGGVLLPALPSVLVTLLLVATTGLALLRSRGLLNISPGRKSLIAAGSGIGALAATSGGAGFLVAPVVMSTGLKGLPYVATVSCCAVALHIGRVAGYGISGLLVAGLLPMIGALLVGLIAGNLIAARYRDRIPTELESKIEIGALVTTALLALAGVAN